MTAAAARRRRAPSTNGFSAGESAILSLLQGGLGETGSTATQRPEATIDPTKNVIDLVGLHVRRLDDLRIGAMQRQDDLRLASDKRQDDLREATTYWRNRLDDHRDEMIRIRFAAQGDLAQAESRRIDAQMIAEARRIDALLAAAANAVTLASTRAELTATALAERVDTSAKTLAGSVEASASSLRLQVQTTNEAIATQIGILRSETGNRLTSLEQSRYKLGGAEDQRLNQRVESRWEAAQRTQRTQWSTGLYVGGGLALGGLALGIANFASAHIH